MSLDIGGSGGGADMLQQVLERLANQAYQNQQIQIAAQRNAIDQQRANTEDAYRQMTASAMAGQRAATAQGAREAAAARIAGILPPGQDISDPTAQLLSQGGLGDLVNKTPQVPTTNLSGVADATGGAPQVSGLTSSVNPGLAPKTTFSGTAAQQKEASDARQLQTLLSDPSVPEGVRQFLKIRSAVPGGAVPSELFKPEAATEDVYQTGPNGQLIKAGTVPKGSHIANAPNPVQDHFVLQTVPDPDNPGKTVVLRVDMTNGSASPITLGGQNLGGKTPANAALDTRLKTAKAVVETGNDIVQMLSDPKVIAQLGPAMGRYNSVADFIGNAPPDFKKLAGMIESYSLANMGVHGMRSASGAEAIKNTLGQTRSTPEAMIGAIQGLNGFANHLLEDNPTAGQTGSSGPKPTAADLIKKYGGG